MSEFGTASPPGDEAETLDENLRDMLLHAVRRGPKITDSHLSVLDKDFSVDGTKTLVHCYAPALDANGRLKPKALAQFLFDRIIDYAIPRKAVEAAQEQMLATGSTAEWIKLQRKAKGAFTHLDNSGEGGELLLFALAETVFEFAQILCKMSLKTSTSMHYNGADGVYASTTEDGYLNVYWGESKLYKSPTDAITDCLKSLAPFLREEFSDDATNAQDIYLVNEYANLTDPLAVAALKRFFDPDCEEAKHLRLCGFALVGFDVQCFPQTEQAGIWDEIEAALREQLPNWRSHIGKRLGDEKLELFDIHFICIPMRSVKEFRDAFMALLKGVS